VHEEGNCGPEDPTDAIDRIWLMSYRTVSCCPFVQSSTVPYRTVVQIDFDPDVWRLDQGSERWLVPLTWYKMLMDLGGTDYCKPSGRTGALLKAVRDSTSG